MKKVILIAFILLASLSINAQIIKLYAFEAIYSVEGINDRQIDIDYFATIDIKEMKVHFYSQVESYYTLLKSTEQWTDEHGVINTKYRALDKQNDPCNLIISKYQKAVNIIIDYGDWSYLYKTRIVN